LNSTVITLQSSPLRHHILQNICHIHFSYITANYGQNTVSLMLKCFSFWGLRLLTPLLWSQLGDVRPQTANFWPQQKFITSSTGGPIFSSSLRLWLYKMYFKYTWLRLQVLNTRFLCLSGCYHSTAVVMVSTLCCAVDVSTSSSAEQRALATSSACR